MKPMRMNLTAFVILSAGLFGMTAVRAGEDFADSIRVGEEQLRYGDAKKALVEFETAHQQAANDTERAIALSKQAYANAYYLENYSAAREQAQEALDMKDVHPVGHVTALQVLAKCEMEERDAYKSAIEILEEAMALRDVEWAQPTLALMLGDCHRFEGRTEQALDAYRRVTSMSGADRAIQGVAYLNIGITYQYNLQQPEPAREAYEKAEELNASLKEEIASHLSRIP